MAALLTAVVGACALAYQVSRSEPLEPNSPSNQTPATQALGQTSSPSAATGQARGPLWHGTLLFDNNGVDFDTTPPTAQLSTGIDVYDGGGNQIVTYGASHKNVAKWAIAGEPTATACAELLGLYGVNTAVYDQGTVYCVRTRGAGRIVYLKFLGPRDGAYEIEATIWPSLR
ncbi:hypothetical protein [Micromonospora musae]|uniref:hypothetical protein n=1 Tax=Micromonospora musae TaxID=1894970 RepID=UPI0011C37676|nr:hypothetical protein [Micromonospora musae]